MNLLQTGAGSYLPHPVRAHPAPGNSPTMTCDMKRRIRQSPQAWYAAACLLIAIQTGCTSALTASYLHEGLWDRDDHAAMPADENSGESDTSQSNTAEGAEATATVAANPEADRARREAALEEAMARLSKMGSLDPAVEAALVATLQRTQPEDWPVVVDEFVASLPPATASATDAVAIRAADPPAEQAASREATAVATDDTPQADHSDDTTVDPDPQPTSATAATDFVEPAAPPALAVRSACFASAVRAWGEVDRFTSNRFHPGQEVIVYVELENLAANESPAGHTTCIDAALRLVDGSDRTLHAWKFDPVAETSTGRRHDYFARYIVRIPDSAPAGDCRVEMAVTDTLAGETATTVLPLEIAAAE